MKDDLNWKELHVKSGKAGKSVLTDVIIDRPGRYRVGKLIDGNGSEGRFESEAISVIFCPQARMDGLVVRHGVEMCSGNVFPLKVWLAGKAPFTVSLDLINDERIEQIVVPNIIPSSSEAAGDFKLWTFELSGPKSLNQFLVRIASVQDAGGHVHQYGAWDNGDAVIVDLVSPPVIKWSENVLPKIREDQKSIPLKVSLSGRSPFSFKIERPDGHVVTMKNHLDSVATIDATMPGIYTLKSIQDNVCVGIVDMRHEMTVELVHPPTMQASVEALKSPCQGDMGLAFSFMITGDGPWQIHAKQKYRPKLSKSHVKVKESSNTFVINVPTPRFQYTWRPDRPGSYELELVTLSDINYRGLPLKDYRYVQDINPAPDAILGARETMFACAGDEIRIPATLGGTGPWNLGYSLASPDGSLQNLFSKSDDEPKIELRLGPFVMGGRYVLSLISVTDGTGCSASLSASQTRAITVFAHAPSATFQSERVQVREASSDLVPIKISANKLPVTLILRHYRLGGGDEERLSLVLDSATNGLYLNKPGRYEIESVQDAYCSRVGAAALSEHGLSTVEVVILPKPTVQFAEKLATWTCKSHNVNPLQVHGTGTGNISVKYTVQYALDEVDLQNARKERKVITGQSAILNISPVGTQHAPGYYRYELLSISDSIFSEQPVSGMSFVQQVLPDPAPRIAAAQRGGTASFCYDEAQRDIGPFVLDFTGSEVPGSLPVKFKAELLQGTVVKGIEEITANDLVVPVKFKLATAGGPGSYSVRITWVQNAFGCVWNAPTQQGINAAIKDQTALAVQLIERPSITHVESGDLCVGDVAKFDLKGTGPWSITYTMKNSKSQKQKTDTVSVNRFNILLAESGTLHVDSLCNEHCCASLPTELSNFSIYALPSAAITEGTQYLHEGEEANFTVALHGVPPFAFSYQRIDDTDGRIIETAHVSDVSAPEHVIKVTNSGTFRVVSVRDRYCQYPKKLSSHSLS
jgi:nucleoporin POM152